MIDFTMEGAWSAPPRALMLMVPIVENLLSGRLYVDIPVDRVLRCLADSRCRVADAWGAMGPALFHGRDDGPWVPYDRTTVDQNWDVPVCDRKFPWSWGDEIWVSCRWDMLRFAARFDLVTETAALFIEGTKGVDIPAATRRWATTASRGFAVKLPVMEFSASATSSRRTG